MELPESKYSAVSKVCPLQTIQKQRTTVLIRPAVDRNIEIAYYGPRSEPPCHETLAGLRTH